MNEYNFQDNYKITMRSLGGHLQLIADCGVPLCTTVICSVRMGKKPEPGAGEVYAVYVGDKNVVRRGTAAEIVIKQKIRFDWDMRKGIQNMIDAGMILESYPPRVIDCVQTLINEAYRLSHIYDFELSILPGGGQHQFFNYRLPISMQVLAEDEGYNQEATDLINELVPLPQLTEEHNAQ